jgi:alanyl-tRNA synthetase
MYINGLNYIRKTVFTGYDTPDAKSSVTGIINNGLLVSELNFSSGEEFFLILDNSPFYGGKEQIFDTGILSCDDFTLNVIEVNDNDGYLFHLVKTCNGGKVFSGKKFSSSIDIMRRNEISRHHTASHLLYKAIKSIINGILPENISVFSDKLIFNFFYKDFLSDEEILSIEKKVYENVIADYPVLTFITTFERAKSFDSVIFNNKCYDKNVRICKIDNVSSEICYGTHVIQTGEIGFVKIIRQSFTADGLLTLEAVAEKIYS